MASHLQALARLVAVVSVGSLLATCGSPDEAVPSGDERVTSPAEPVDFTDVPETPTFSRDIAPVVFSHCVPCHRPGEVAPFSLISYNDVRRRARQIVEVTSDRYMPPWQPEPGYGSFRDARNLSEVEIETLRRWVDTGAEQGDSESLPELPSFESGWQLGEPDLVVRVEEGFTLGADVTQDVFRNFVLPIDVSEAHYVKGVEFRPDNRQVVHHASILTDIDGTARQLDALDDEPGYSGMVGATAPGGHFTGWTPGRVASFLEEGMAWELLPGMDLVVEMHLLPTGREERIQPWVGLYFTDEPPRLSPASIHLASTTIDVPAGDTSYTVKDSFVVPVDVDTLAAYPHAHYLGREVKAWAELPSGERQQLLWIRDWDFNWQDEYYYQEPVFLPARTTLYLEIVYDNSADNPRNPNQPPKRVRWGPQSADEMGDLWLKVAPRDPGQLQTLRRSILDKDLQLARVGYESTLEVDPDDFEARSLLGYLLLRGGEVRGAIPHLTRALTLEPDAWTVHVNLGSALLQIGELERAAESYRKALSIYPDHAEAHNNLGVTLGRLGDFEGALDHYRDSLVLRPNDAHTLSNLGALLTGLDHLIEAEAVLARAVELEPASTEVLKNFANVLARQGRVEEAVSHLEEVLRLDPSDTQSRHFLALGLVELDRIDEAVSHLDRVPGEEARALRRQLLSQR